MEDEETCDSCEDGLTSDVDDTFFVIEEVNGAGTVACLCSWECVRDWANSVLAS